MSTLDKAPSSLVPTTDLPPLTTTTQGIPPSEHLEQIEVATVSRPLRTTGPWVFRVLFGALVLLVLGAFAVGMSAVLTPPPTDLHMGLSDAAWSEYRTGERAVPPLVNPVPFNPFLEVTPFGS